MSKVNRLDNDTRLGIATTILAAMIASGKFAEATDAGNVYRAVKLADMLGEGVVEIPYEHGAEHANTTQVSA